MKKKYLSLTLLKYHESINNDIVDSSACLEYREMSFQQYKLVYNDLVKFCLNFFKCFGLLCRGQDYLVSLSLKFQTKEKLKT